VRDFDSSSSESWEAKRTKLDSDSNSPQNWRARGANSQNWEAKGAKINQPIVYPAFPQIKIWQPSVEGLGYDISTLPTLYSGSRKRVIKKPENFPIQPFPLAHIFFLEESTDFKVTPMSGNEAFLTLARFFPIPSQLLEGKTLEQHFQQCLQLISQVELWKLERQKDFKKLISLIILVEQKLQTNQQQVENFSLLKQ
jgi:hypothetical protein